MRRFYTSFSALCAILLVTTFVNAQGRSSVEVRPAVRQGSSIPLRDITTAPAAATRGEFEPKRFNAPSGTIQPKDTVTQGTVSASVAVTAGLNFEGVGEGLAGYNVNVAPPDTTGDVGATQYVQWVNLSFAVFDKISGQMIAGPTAGNALFQSLGGPCATRNDGDPIVQYDQIAGRWVLTQFAVPGGKAGYHQCVAVSKTSDATGAYWLYQFDYADFNDYPHMGVWPDGYYIAYNMFKAGRTFNGGVVCALDRTSMLAGLPATQQCFNLGTSIGGLQPSDMDGITPPPPGSPNYVMNFGTNSLNLWKFHVDWTNPANTTLTGPTNIPVAAFNKACGGGTCVPQPGTSQQLDSLGDRLMYRLAYRNFGTYENLVVNHSVRVNSTDNHTGVRWYEIRNPGGTPTLFQQSTYAPDGNYRWMGSAAMDKVGNLAVGFSISSASLKPSIRFAARTPADPANTLSSETELLAGTGVQTSTLARWGDYSTLSIDPVDDCTFWFTTEYQAVNGTFNWHTRIASFKLQGCQ